VLLLGSPPGIREDRRRYAFFIVVSVWREVVKLCESIEFHPRVSIGFAVELGIQTNLSRQTQGFDVPFVIIKV
jgi:hypothetical protein